MKIKKLEIDGFRCLLDFKIIFEDDLTVIVGENDSGKTSLIECLKVVTQNKSIAIDDFNHGKDIISLKVEIENFIFEKTYTKKDGLIKDIPIIAKPTKEYLNKIQISFDDINFDITANENIEYVKNTAKTFGLLVRSNSKIESLKESILSKISDATGNDNFLIENAVFPQFNNIQLNGRQFENVSTFFKEVFLKEKQSSIWQEKVDGEKTIEEFVKSKIDSYSSEITAKIEEKGIKEKIQLFIKDLTEIRIEPIYQSKDLNIDAKVKFLENGQEINLENKGDGTKRRISMALLEFKKEEALLSHDKTTFYLLDEPDTHLHVKAQLELLSTMESFAKNGNQVILTTHSPFIINAISPKQIRLLENNGNISKIKTLRDDIDSSNRLLKSLGVENTHLFFSRVLIIVEGETEEKFISTYYMNKIGRLITSDLIKIINVEGISNIHGFARAILELHDPENIYLVFDNDASQELSELINKLSIPDERKFIIGNKEFEDAFQTDVLHRCWLEYLQESEKPIPNNWTIENIEAKKKNCLEQSSKFSKELRSLAAGSKKMSKPILGEVLGKYIDDDEVPSRLMDIFKAIL